MTTTYTYWQLHTDQAGITWLTLDVPGRSTNVLANAVRAELRQVLDSFAQNTPKALIFASGKKSGFIAGADIDEFALVTTAEQTRALIQEGWDLMNRIAALPFPTLALVHGHCMGGGLELALACRYRVLTDAASTRLSLPEVMLGIVPGWGGMLRLPQAIGAPEALNMMLSGRTLDARKAGKLGLADAVVPERIAAIAAAKIVLNGSPRRALPLMTRVIRSLSAGPLKSIVARQARATLNRKVSAKNYPAPFAILDIWQNHNGNALTATGSMQTIVESPTARNLQRVYHLQERLKGLAKNNTFQAKTVHVIGAGVMGGDIAVWCALRGLRVTLEDTSEQALSAVVKRAAILFKKKLKQPLLVRDAMDRLIPDPKGLGVGNADVVIEAIFENLEAKHALFKRIEPQLKADAILASNTSSLRLEDVATVLAQPARLIGLHFFNPVSLMPLVEVVSTAQTDSTLFDNAKAFVRQIDKLPLPVASAAGFLVNAALGPYMLAAMRCVDEGFDINEVDAAMRDFGMPMGPMELIDMVGLDIARAAGQALSGEPQSGDPTASVPKCLQTALDKGYLGRKNGQGFYLWTNGKAQRNTAVQSNRFSAIQERLITPMRDRVKNLVETKVIADAELADAGMIFGAGYAPHTGGILWRAQV